MYPKKPQYYWQWIEKVENFVSSHQWKIAFLNLIWLKTFLWSSIDMVDLSVKWPIQEFEKEIFLRVGTYFLCLYVCLSVSLFLLFIFFLSSQLYLFESRFYIGSNSAHDVWEVWDGDMISPGIRNKLLLYLL